MRNPFGGLFHKKRRHDEFGLRSHILNERYSEPFDPYAQPAPSPSTSTFGERQSVPFNQGYEEFTPKTRDVFSPFPTQQEFGPPAPPPFESQAAEKVNRDYDIMDRLSLIESQLAAIRSQTELINERLKNMESRLGLGRRY